MHQLKAPLQYEQARYPLSVMYMPETPQNLLRFADARALTGVAFQIADNAVIKVCVPAHVG